MQKIFLWEKGKLTLNKTEFLLIPEFSKLYNADKTRDKRVVYAQFTYIYLTADFLSPLWNMSEIEKEKEAIKAAQIEITDEVLITRRKYRELVETPEIKMYNAAKALVDNMRDFLGNVDMNERDPISAKPIHDIKKLQDSVKNLGPMLKELENLREQAFRSIDNTNIRGGQQKGYLD